MDFNTPIECTHDIIIEVLRDFFKSAKKSKAVVGLSGGIDSAVVLSLGVKALGKDNITAILMPSPFSTMHSVSDAVELAENLGVKYHISPIGSIFNKYIKELNSLFGEEPKKITVENIQARIRGVLLMAFANQNDALLLNTTNKSELAMGYGTLYGDLCGAIMPIADLYKLQVYELAKYINLDIQVIPDSTLTKEPSAELSDNQKDSDTLPEYHILDPILYATIDQGKSHEELIKSGVEVALLEKIKNLRLNSTFKVHQLPPVIKLTANPLLPENKWIF